MIHLPNDCKHSEFNIFPKNWETKKADIKLIWYIKYRFYEPGKKEKQVMLKGMNDARELEKRQAITKNILERELSDLKSGYNPWHRNFTQEHLTDISPNTLFFHALQYACENAPFIPETIKDILWVLRATKKAAESLNYLSLSIGDVRTKHIKMLFDRCKKMNPALSNNTYNVYRKYFLKLFKILKQYEAVEMNPVEDIEKLPIITRIRASLTKEEEIFINEYLQKNYPEFHRFLHIFYQSGARIKEIMRLQVKDVYMNKQEFKITVFKGRSYKEVIKAVNDEVLPLWQKQLKNAKPNDYVFSEGLLPGATPIKAYQITKRWRRLVKIPLGITADFYSLKHSKITAVSDAQSQKMAAELASHSGEKIIAKVYDLNADKRYRDELKKIKTPFGAK